MVSTPVQELIPVLQIAIGPVILISGVGLLLLSSFKAEKAPGEAAPSAGGG